MQTVIMAGGKGTRIRSLRADVPKPLMEIEGKPILAHEIDCLRRQGFTDIIITVSHLGQQIVDYFGNGQKFGVNIRYFNETVPLGNAGALFKLRSQLKDPFLLLDGDVIFNVDLQRFVDFHYAKGGLATLFAYANNHPEDCGLLVTDDNGTVLQWFTKEDVRPEWYENCVNGGLHILRPQVLDRIDPSLVGQQADGKTITVDLDRQILKPLCATGKLFCYKSPEYIQDMGTPQRYAGVCEDFKTGRIYTRNLQHRQKAVFLTRDGVVNCHGLSLHAAEDFTLLPGVSQAVRTLNEAGRLVIMFSALPAIPPQEAVTIHHKMETLLSRDGAYIDKIYNCTQPAETADPVSGGGAVICSEKLRQAAQTFNIDLAQSWVVSADEETLSAGISVGCKTAFVGTKNAGRYLTASSLAEVVPYLLNYQEPVTV